MITKEQIVLAAEIWAGKVHDGDSSAEEVVNTLIDFTAGAKWALEQQSGEIHKALKGLGLEKHSIALNVLRIAGIEPPEKERR